MMCDPSWNWERTVEKPKKGKDIIKRWQDYEFCFWIMCHATKLFLAKLKFLQNIVCLIVNHIKLIILLNSTLIMAKNKHCIKFCIMSSNTNWCAFLQRPFNETIVAVKTKKQAITVYNRWGSCSIVCVCFVLSFSGAWHSLLSTQGTGLSPVQLCYKPRLITRN